MSGISDEKLTLVRNPRYDARTDSRAARESNPDRFVFVAAHAGGARSPVQLVLKVAAGELDDAVLYASPRVIGKYAASAARRGRLRVDPVYWRFYVSMNLTQPPFDDVHVRKAMSWVVDRAAFRRVAGGPLEGAIAQHIVPDGLLGGRLRGFAPFKTPGDHGSLAKAKAEMSKSRYATKGGVCIAKACKHVFFSPLFDCSCYAVGQRIAPIIMAEAAELGIVFQNHGRDFDKFLTPSANIAIVPNAEWQSDYPDPADFFDRFFAASSILSSGNWNTSLLGITPARAARLGVKGRVGRVPSVDRDLVRCSALTGPRRIDCYAALDRKLSADVVPWIPLLWRSRINILGRQVTRWAFDQSSGTTSFAHVAVGR
jgi:ABC-type transport system substrate-binding protein